jgi:signal transduction histidine kinase/ActR/RegA family two-component response regulator
VVLAAMTKQTAGTYDETYRVVRPDGTIRWVRDRAFPIRDEQGVMRRVVGVAEDISERKKLEEQFLRAQRLEAIGTLSSGIAHDLNNILAPMLMVGALLQDKLSDPHDLTLLEMVEQGAQRGAGIIKQLLTFSRGIGGDRGIVQLRHLVKEMAGIMRETFPREIAIVEVADAELWPVVADATQLHQVLMNLCVNARDAMPGGGALRLAADNVQLGETEAGLHAEAKPGRYAVLTVADSGHGIPREIISRIFEPFFTTKEIGKGTGLGLSTAVGIVRSHGGFVVVDSEPGRGTKFRVFLPAAEGADRAAPTSVADHSPGGKQELILVVDDEPAIRATLRHLLERHHYAVLTAAHGLEALEALQRERENVRLILTDVMMPVMGGIPLIRAAQALVPTVKIVATTGLDDQGRRAELGALGVAEILMKPFNTPEILAALRRHLPPAN